MRQRSLAIGLAVAAASLGVAPAAQADTWRHRDATGDALVVDRSADNSVVGPHVDPAERRGDIGTVTVRHASDTLSIGAGVRATDGLDQKITFYVATSRYTYEIGYFNYGGKGTTLRRNGYRYTCSGVVVTPTAAGYLATVPRSCLTGAYRIRVGVQTDVYTGESDDYYERHINDDFLRTGRYTDRRPKLSPWIVGG